MLSPRLSPSESAVFRVMQDAERFTQSSCSHEILPATLARNFRRLRRARHSPRGGELGAVRRAGGQWALGGDGVAGEMGRVLRRVEGEAEG